MAKKPVRRIKHVPQRTCVGCRQVLPKRTMVRVVRTSEGVRVDPTGKVSGRGAYLHSLRSCWERGLRGSLAHALKTELTDQDKETLQLFAAGLPDEGPSVDEIAAQAEGSQPSDGVGESTAM